MSIAGLDATEGLHSTGNSFNIELILFMRLFLYDGAMNNSCFGLFLSSTGKSRGLLHTYDSRE